MLLTRSDSIAVIDADNEQSYTYEEIACAAETICSSLELERKGLILILAKNEIGCLLAYLAALQSRNAVALLDANLPPEKIDALIACYQPEIVVDCSLTYTLSQDLYRESTFSSPINVSLKICKSLSAGKPPAPELKLLLPTSGSTGEFKAVRLSLNNIESNATSIAKALQIQSSDRAVLSLPLHYSYGLSVLNSHLISGASVVLSSAALTSKDFWSHCRNYSCSSFAGVPYAYEILNRLNPASLDVPTIKTFTQAGGKLSNKLIEKFDQYCKGIGGRFFVMYGQTEATARMTILPSEELSGRIGSVGLAIPGGKIEIHGANTSDGSGEVVYRGPNVMLGYANDRADLSCPDSNQGTLWTGDLGYLDNDGFLYITGRTKRIAKIFGIRLSLDEIESSLQKFGPTAVISDDQILIVCHERGASANFEPEMVRKRLAEELSVHHSFIRVMEVDELPRTGSGKIDYNSLSRKTCL